MTLQAAFSFYSFHPQPIHYSVAVEAAVTIRLLTSLLVALPFALAKMTPPQLLQGHSYLRIESATAPDALSAALANVDGAVLTYRGQVGELSDEHIYEVTVAGNVIDPSKLDSAVVTAVKHVPGVKQVEVLVHKQRARRDEF